MLWLVINICSIIPVYAGSGTNYRDRSSSPGRWVIGQVFGPFLQGLLLVYFYRVGYRSFFTGPVISMSLPA